MATTKAVDGFPPFGYFPLPIRRLIFIEMEKPRLVGVSPLRDMAAPAVQNIISRICVQSRSIFSRNAIRLWDAGRPFVPVTEGERVAWVYINPFKDVLYLGYDTIDPEHPLIKAPISPHLATRLKRVWLHDIDVPLAVGYTSFEVDAIEPAVKIDLSSLFYLVLERVTITSEKVSPTILDEVDGYTEWKFIYHIETDTVLVSQGTVPENAIIDENTQRRRLSGEDLFKVEVLFDRKPALVHDTNMWFAVNHGDTHASAYTLAPDSFAFVWAFSAEYLLKRLVLEIPPFVPSA